VEWLTGETEVLRVNLPQCRFVHHKPNMRTQAAAVGSQRLTAWAMGTARIVRCSGISFHCCDKTPGGSAYFNTCQQFFFICCVCGFDVFRLSRVPFPAGSKITSLLIVTMLALGGRPYVCEMASCSFKGRVCFHNYSLIKFTQNDCRVTLMAVNTLLAEFLF
jgi:hypothetical protein